MTPCRETELLRPDGILRKTARGAPLGAPRLRCWPGQSGEAVAAEEKAIDNPGRNL